MGVGCGCEYVVGVYLHVFLCLFSVYYAGSKAAVKLFLANNCTTSPCAVQRLHNASIEVEFVPSMFFFPCETDLCKSLLYCTHASRGPTAHTGRGHTAHTSRGPTVHTLVEVLLYIH